MALCDQVHRYALMIGGAGLPVPTGSLKSKKTVLLDRPGYPDAKGTYILLFPAHALWLEHESTRSSSVVDAAERRPDALCRRQWRRRLYGVPAAVARPIERCRTRVQSQ